MKKKMIVLLLVLFMITGCKGNVLTKDIFLEKARDNAYIIQNTMSGYEQYEYIEDIYYAVNVSNAYDIQFIILRDDDYAKRFYEVNKQELMSLADGNTYTKYINTPSHSTYHLENDSKYMLVIRYKNNVLYIDAPISYINEIEEFLNEMDLDY